MYNELIAGHHAYRAHARGGEITDELYKRKLILPNRNCRSVSNSYRWQYSNRGVDHIRSLYHAILKDQIRIEKDTGYPAIHSVSHLLDVLAKHDCIGRVICYQTERFHQYVNSGAGQYGCAPVTGHFRYFPDLHSQESYIIDPMLFWVRRQSHLLVNAYHSDPTLFQSTHFKIYSKVTDAPRIRNKTLLMRGVKVPDRTYMIAGDHMKIISYYRVNHANVMKQIKAIRHIDTGTRIGASL